MGPFNAPRAPKDDNVAFPIAAGTAPTRTERRPIQLRRAGIHARRRGAAVDGPAAARYGAGMRGLIDIADHDRLPGRFVGLARGVTARR